MALGSKTGPRVHEIKPLNVVSLLYVVIHAHILYKTSVVRLTA